jgi:phospholipid/cholesterol/gamma-HCH transport system permease protein
MDQPAAYFEIDHTAENGPTLRLRGDWILADAPKIKLDDFSNEIKVIDATDIGRLDMWGTLQLKKLFSETQAQIILNSHQQKIFTFLPQELAQYNPEIPSLSASQIFMNLGQSTISGLQTLCGFIAFIGEIFITFLKNCLSPRRFRFHSIIRHIDETGLRAIPIVGLLAVLISMVVSYQAATQLTKFGANIFTVDLTVISLLREMGVLITAIMVAGRSGSAFAAEIGVMKLREEIDALKTMGFNPVEVLVLPRLIALLLTLPVLAFLAVIIGLIGGSGIAVLFLDISLDQYINRVQSVATPTMFLVGMVKAPVFAFIIALVGTYQGLSVSGSAESIGKQTTIAVVQSIFLVIMADAIFSIIFAQMGI